MQERMWLFKKGDQVPLDWYEHRNLERPLMFGADVEVELRDDGFRHLWPQRSMEEDEVLVHGEPRPGQHDGVVVEMRPPFFFHCDPQRGPKSEAGTGIKILPG